MSELGQSLIQACLEVILSMHGDGKMKKLRVHVVLEHNKGRRDCKIHGVYARRCAAEQRAERVTTKKSGYISILEMPVKDADMLGIHVVSRKSGKYLTLGLHNTD